MNLPWCKKKKKKKQPIFAYVWSIIISNGRETYFCTQSTPIFGFHKMFPFLLAICRMINDIKDVKQISAVMTNKKKWLNQ